MRKLLPLLGLFLWAMPANANVAFGSNGGVADVASGAGNITFTLATISTGANLMGRVDVTWHDAAVTVTGVTWGGVSMAAACAEVTQASENTQIWVLAAPATGTPQVIVTFSSTISGNGHADGLTYTGVNQSTIARVGSCNPTPDTGTSTSASVTVTSQIGDMTASCVVTTGSLSGTNQTQRTLDNNGVNIAIGSDDAAGAATVTHTWTLTNANWAVTSFSIAQVSGGTGGTNSVGPSKIVGPSRAD